MTESTELPLTLKCPNHREEWPATSYKSYIDIYAEPLEYHNIHFLCPADHKFTLKTAVKAHMFTKDQADSMLELAKKEVAKFKENFVHGNEEVSGE